MPRRAVALALPVSVLLVAGCSGASTGTPPVTGAELPVSTTSPKGEGTIRVRLQEIDGVYVEGFQLGLRLEAPPGRPVIASTWEQLVHDQHKEPTMEDYYDTVVSTTAPAGPFVLRTVMHPGMEPAQEPCVTRGRVEPGATVTVTVKFSSQDGCSVVS